MCLVAWIIQSRKTSALTLDDLRGETIEVLTKGNLPPNSGGDEETGEWTEEEGSGT